MGESQVGPHRNAVLAQPLGPANEGGGIVDAERAADKGDDARALILVHSVFQAHPAYFHGAFEPHGIAWVRIYLVKFEEDCTHVLIRCWSNVDLRALKLLDRIF